MGLGPLQLSKNFAQALQRKLYINSIAFQLKSLKTLIYMAPRVHIEYSIQEFEKCTSKLMKVLLFHKFKNICSVERQYFGLGTQIVSLFLNIGTLGDMAIQSCII